jgi:uncharacterized protein YuzE
MRLKYDLNVGALYIGLADSPVARTREIDDNTFVDLGPDGAVAGIEVISIEHPWALDDILRDYEIAPDEAAQLRAYFKDETGNVRESPEVSMRRNASVLVA